MRLNFPDSFIALNQYKIEKDQSIGYYDQPGFPSSSCKPYKFFDVLVCGDEVQKGKPHPEIFLSAAEKLNLPTSECLMFEDSENGITSAYNAGGVTILLQDIKEPNSNMLAKTDYFFESMGFVAQT